MMNRLGKMTVLPSELNLAGLTCNIQLTSEVLSLDPPPNFQLLLSPTTSSVVVQPATRGDNLYSADKEK
jgi:hypothetical protein